MTDITKKLVDKTRQWASTAGDFITLIDGLMLTRQDAIFRHDNIYAAPRLLVGLQGCRYTVSDHHEYWFGPNQCLVLGGNLISSSRAPGACSLNPFLSISLSLNGSVIKQLLEEAPYLSRPIAENAENQTTVTADSGVMEAFFRLVTLLEKPSQIPYLAPLFIKEIHYRLLLGPLNPSLRNLGTPPAHCQGLNASDKGQTILH